MCGRTTLSGLILALLLAGGDFLLRDAPAAAPAGPSDKKDAKIQELLKERLATLRELVKAATADYRAGRTSFDRVEHATRILLDAELEQCESHKERIKVLEEIVALAKETEKSAVQRYRVGAATQSDALMAAASRLEAEIALERAKTKVARVRPK